MAETIQRPEDATVRTRRLPLKPWLIYKLESEAVSGLQWVDKQNGIFKILWTGSTWSHTNDNQLFKAWAIHTGKFVDGDSFDYSKWKRNLRCALHKAKDIENLTTATASNDQNDAYRIYQFLDIHKKQQNMEEIKDNKLDNPSGSGVPLPTFIASYVSSDSESEYNVCNKWNKTQL